MLHRRRPLWRSWAAAAVVALMAVACGSTAQVTGGSTYPSAGAGAAGDEQLDLRRDVADGLGGHGEDRAAGSGLSPQDAAAGAGGGGGITIPGRPGSSSTAVGASSPREGNPQADTSDEPVRIGYVTTEIAGFGGRLGSGEDAFSSAGDANRNAEKREMAALVQYANDLGGIGGRPIEAIEFPVSAAELSANYTESICVAAADDHGVLAMIDRSYLNFEQAMSCFAKKGVTLIGIQPTITDREFFHTLRPYVASNWPTMDRIVTNMVHGLDEVGYFEDAVVGIIADDGTASRRVYGQHMEPALRAIGVEPAAVVYVSAETTEPATAEIANAVLRFRTLGVTHVVNLLSLINFVAFQQQAESQGYRPRYGFGDYVGGVSAAVGFGQPEQNHGAIGVSVDPRAVIDSAESPGWSGLSQRRPAETPENTTPGQQRCYEVLSKYTDDDYYAPSNNSISYRWHCDHFFLWFDAARNVGAGLTPQRWGDGLATLGAGQDSTIVYRTEFAAGRFDGASASRIGQYERSCQCFIGQRPWVRFPW